MIKNIILTAVAALSLGASATAQSGALPVLHLQQDVRAAGMAGVISPKATGNLYSSPTDVLEGCCSSKLRAQAILGLTTDRGDLSSQMATITGSYRMGRHAVLLGARYLGLAERDFVSSSGMVRGQINPRDWTIDLGYAYRFNRAFAAFARGSFVQSYNSLNADVLTFSIGGSYRTDFTSKGRTVARLVSVLSLDNLGGKYSYGEQGTKYALPSSCNASLAVSFLKDQRLTLGVRASSFFKAEGGERSALIGLGAEYQLLSALALRGGYTHQSDVSVWSVGLGAQLGQWRVDAGYDLHSQSAFNYLRLGVGLAL